MVDIARPDLPVARRRRQLILGGAAFVALVVASVAVSRLRPAAPTVERASVWIDTVKRGPFVREERGLGTLVPEDLRWIPAVAEGRVERIRLFPSSAVTPDTVILELSNPAFDQAVRDAARGGDAGPGVGERGGDPGGPAAGGPGGALRHGPVGRGRPRASEVSPAGW